MASVINPRTVLFMQRSWPATNRLRRLRRAQSMIEQVTVLAIIGILGAGGYALFSTLEGRTGATRYQNELRQYADSLAHYQATRGYFPVDRATLSRLEPGVDFLPSGEAVSEGQFAFSIGTVSGIPVLGIATIGSNGKCHTLTRPPLDEDSVVEATATFQPGPSVTCSGATALAQNGSAW